LEGSGVSPLTAFLFCFVLFFAFLNLTAIS
jgi:hypothetical protein